MPSATSARIEKQGSLEVQDPLKQVQSLIEKKLRNLEKRKTRLEQMKEEQKSGKALNEDQQKAVKRHDQVIEMLDIFKDFHKNVSSIFAEHAKNQKKVAKKEQLEKQQQEAEKIKTIIVFQDLLNSMGAEEVRKDFLAGNKKAQKLDQSKLNCLDELFKLVSPDRNAAEEVYKKQVDKAAESLIFLVDGKSKAVHGKTTFKEMKELLISIKESGYFSPAPAPTPAPAKAVTLESVTSVVKNQPAESAELVKPVQQQLTSEETQFASQKQQKPHVNQMMGQIQQGQVLGTGFNFLQESQIETPHMDPAVVAAMGPVPYPNPQFVQGTGHQDYGELAAQLQMTNSSNAKVSPVFGNAVGHQPIPTQTFTNQSYATTMFVPVSLTGNNTNIAHSIVGLPMQQMPANQISPHNTSPEMMVTQEQSQQQMSQTEQLQNYTNQNFDFQTDRAASQEKTFGDENNFGNQGYNRGPYRGGNRRGGRNPTGSNMNGHGQRQNSGRPGGRGGYQGNYGNYGNMNGQNYNQDKRGSTNSGNQSGMKPQGNRNQGGRYSQTSTGQGAGGNRNTGAAVPNTK